MEQRSEASREQRRKYIKRKREICIAFKVCRSCMCKDAEPGKLMCTLCLKKSRQIGKKNYQWYVDNGVCVTCRRNDAAKGKKICIECMRMTTNRASQEAIERNRRRKKRKAEVAEALGVCNKCFKREAVKGYKKCLECRAKDAKRVKHVGISKPKLWQEQGLCYQCGSNTLPGRKQCEKHYLISKAQADKLNVDTSNHIWRKYSDMDVARQLNRRNG